MKGIPGPVLADVAANVLAMTLVVLIALGQFQAQERPAAPPIALTAGPVRPVDGASAVELLRQRLLPDAAGLGDLVGDGTRLPPDTRVLFILDPAAYPQVQAELAARGGDWLELTVPKALKTEDNGWHADFLALSRYADNPDRFRIALQDLLIRRHGSASDGTPVALGAEGSSIRLRFAAWFGTALDALGLAALALGLWALSRLRRWAVKA